LKIKGVVDKLGVRNEAEADKSIVFNKIGGEKGPFSGKIRPLLRIGK
jgi:hypothetical protein